MSATDLHVHTTWSDGTLSPARMVKRSAQRGVRVLGIADHDTTDGVSPAIAAGQQHGVTVVAGVEENTNWEGAEVHILGYLMDIHGADVRRELATLRARRDERNTRIHAVLSSLGVGVREERV